MTRKCVSCGAAAALHAPRCLSAGKRVSLPRLRAGLGEGEEMKSALFVLLFLTGAATVAHVVQARVAVVLAQLAAVGQ